MTDHPVIPIAQLAIAAALAVKYGMDEERALRAITLSAAEILGVEKRLGSIERGKDADVVVWSGHPFDIMSRAEAVFVDGKRLELRG